MHSNLKIAQIPRHTRYCSDNVGNINESELDGLYRFVPSVPLCSGE